MINNKRGTPKTLKQAIENGLDDVKNNPGMDAAEIIKAHVRDRLAQRFSAAMFTHDEAEKMLMALFNDVVDEREK